MRTIPEIIRIMKKYKITQEELADDLGIKQQNISSWFSRKSIPKASREKFLKALDDRVNRENSINANIQKIEDTHDNCVHVKLYDMSVSAGVGFDVDSISEMPFSDIAIDRSIIPKHILSSDLRAMRVDGKSMIPTILPNDVVVYKEDIGKYSGDDLYIVNFGGMLMVKRLQFNPELNKFDIISDNNDFKSYHIDLSENQTSMTVIGKVIATIQQ